MSRAASWVLLAAVVACLVGVQYPIPAIVGVAVVLVITFGALARHDAAEHRREVNRSSGPDDAWSAIGIKRGEQ